MLRCLFCLLVICVCFAGRSQVRLEPGQMHYVISVKPNNIFYKDSLYRGSKEFMQLFYRTHDAQLINLYQKHQSNKIAGQVLGFAGSVATIFGISKLSSSGSDKTVGWAMLGGGFTSMLTSGYLLLQGQKNLVLAVALFNQRHNKAALGVGVSPQQAGFVYKF